MTAGDHTGWLSANQRWLTTAIARLRAILANGDVAAAEERLRETAEAMEFPSALGQLGDAFGLAPFERDVLLLCAAVELEGTFGNAIAAAAGDAQQTAPTFGLALSMLPDAHWSALAPHAPLRRWMLLEMMERGPLTSSPIRIAERVLHYLTGVSQMDERWCALVVPAGAPAALPPSHETIAADVDRALHALHAAGAPLLVEFTGNDATGKRDVAATIAAAAGARLYVVDAASLASGDRDVLARLWEREAILAGAALFIDAEELQPDTRRAIAAFLDRMHTLVILGTREPLQLPRARALRFEVSKPPFAEQRDLWCLALGPRAERLDGALDRLPAQFDLGARAIGLAAAVTNGDDEDGAALWDQCRAAARPRMQDLARRIVPRVGWDDLILPARQMSTLREIVMHVRQRAKVYETWGFGVRSSRGLGISVLFSGASGTGKTMAAEVLASELRLDLFQIDLSSVVSKYIGETEENLRRVFDAAEEGGAMLLFDEADALFGKRTEVRDSHDRYANIEVSYLLQRMEAYRGVAILTTNLKNALDAAFLRRLRFIVEFPFPDSAQRVEIWQRAFPEKTPVGALDPAKLARLNASGGTIRNVALNAAFLAAESGESVGMTHMLAAARSEYAKLDRPLTDAEIAGWV
ncbi:MAG TPA: ATP-binding protein [Thermoanaerobaculia bacterium]|nr:ATP-binding protein [Thermoanaerobaculia bacterium]